MRSIKTKLGVALAAVALAMSAGGCVGKIDDGGPVAPDVAADENSAAAAAAGPLSWNTIRAGRQAALDRYLADNAAEYQAFLRRPIGNSGIPTLLLNAFPLVFPDIWGSPGDVFGPEGFFRDPFDPAATLPLGLGLTHAPNGLEVANVSCAACHVGGVIGPSGALITLIGAPNTRFNQLRTAIEETVNDPRYLAALGENALTVGFKTKVLQRRQLLDATLGGYTYNPLRFPNAPNINARNKPGHLDAIGVAMAILTLPELLDPAQAQQITVAVMPPAPAQSDIMSVWRQRARDIAQWDGSIANPVTRNLGAEIGALGDPAAADFQNAVITADFVQDLPPPPYPFDVDMGKAVAGKLLYDHYCLGCHQDNNEAIFPVSQVGTDPNRSQSFTPVGRTRLIAMLRAACVDPAVCDLTDEEIVRDMNSDSGAGKGYVAPPLDGIWARAPYLHNGAVPTLYHLLVPSSRPATFVRGSLRYDQAKVGFVWDSTAASDPHTHTFNTAEAGAARTGHDTAAFNGLDWAQHPVALNALLEYMKTL